MTSRGSGLLWQGSRNKTTTIVALASPTIRSGRPAPPVSVGEPRAFRLPMQGGLGQSCHVLPANVVVLQCPGIHKTPGRDLLACACVRDRATTRSAQTPLAPGTDAPQVHGRLTSTHEAYHSATEPPARTRSSCQEAHTSSSCYAEHPAAHASQRPQSGGAQGPCSRVSRADTPIDEHGGSHAEAIGWIHEAGPAMEGDAHWPRLKAGFGARAAAAAGAWFALGCITGIALASQFIDLRGRQAPVEPCTMQGHARAPLTSQQAWRRRRPEAVATLPRPHRMLQGITGCTADAGNTLAVHQAVPCASSWVSSALCNPAMPGPISHTCEPPPGTSSERMMHSGVLAAHLPRHTVLYSGSSSSSCPMASLATKITPGGRGRAEMESSMRQASGAHRSVSVVPTAHARGPSAKSKQAPLQFGQSPMPCTSGECLIVQPGGPFFKDTAVAAPEVCATVMNAPHVQSEAASRRKVNAWATAAANKVLPSVVHLSVDREVERQGQGSSWGLGPLLLRGPGGPHAALEKPALPFLDDFWQSWAREASPSTVVERSYASGIVIASADACLVVTNAHVVAGASGVWARSGDALVPARVIGMHEVADVALLEVPYARGEERRSAAAIGDSSELEIGDAVLCFGSPIGLSRSLSLGVISSLHRTSQDIGIVGKSLTLLQTDCAMNPGSSGGPLVNEFGEVIGMNTAIRADAEGVAFAIPITNVMRVVQSLMPSDYLRHKSL